MDDPVQSARKTKLNTRTFAVRDERGNIFVTVPVLLYKKGDEGYDEMAAYFPKIETGAVGTTVGAVALTSDWCNILPLNSSTNDGNRADDDDK
jgi:hypothetical protein